MDFLVKHIDEINSACENARVRELFAFGSVLTDKFDADSDIDLLVSLHADNPIEYGENYFVLKFALEDILKRKVDLLEEKSVKNRLFRELINAEKKLIYASKN